MEPVRQPGGSAGTGPLSGVRVLEVANMIAAPGSAAIMADLGATVIKVEPRSGDILRNPERVEQSGGYDPWFELDNRGKQGLAIDLGHPEAVTVVHRLAATADVFLTNLTAERQQRFAMTAADIHGVAPTAIHTSLTGYGTAGPDADRLAYDMTAFFARGGIQSLVAEPGGPPAGFRPGQGDHTSSLAILSAVLAALRLRDRTGEGQTVEVALMQVAAWTISTDLSGTLATGADPGLHHRDRWPSPLTCRFRCADDRWVALCMPGPKDFFDPFAVCLGHPEWLLDERFNHPDDRRDNAAELIAACDDAFASATRAEWADRLDHHGLTWAPVQSPVDLVDDPQAAALGVFEPVAGHPAGDVTTVATPFKISGADIGVRGPAPELGQHGRKVLSEAGFSGDEIDALVARSVVGSE
ncbi:MAG: CaiB/BaiF CoA transferase family protein [Acidimicrobiales bacterium]